MATFTLDEEELGEQALPTPTEGKSLLLTPTNASAPVQLDKSWDELIPASYRERVEEEERMKEQLQLYLPRRNRTVQNYCEDSPVKKRPTTEGRRQKRQPPPQRRREEVEVDVSKTVRGFSGNEIRRFVKSYRKFCNAKSRLDELAVDTEMQEKSISELERLLDTLHEGCVQAVTQHRARVEQNPEYDPKRDKGATLHLSGVAINASSILKREEELEGLATVIPANPDARKRYRMVTRAKPVAWPGVRWTAVEDAKLLIGVYEHGLGNWESIHSDPSLGLGKKILPSNKGMKPQSSHLQTRVEYLLKLLQEEAKHKVKKSTKPQPRRKAAVKSDKITKYLVEKPSSEPSTLTVNIPRDLLESERGTVKREGRKRPARSRSHNSPAKRARTSHPPPRTKPLNSVRRDEAEMGRREDAMTPDIGDTELDSVTFQKCKSLLRPVKKYIKNLSPPEELSAEETVEHYKKVLVEIGDHIVTCLSKYKTEEQAMEWRTNLWVFVSKFTSSTPQKLHKIYKKARKEKHLAAVTMPVKKRYLEAATHDGHSHREHYHPGYRDAPSPQ